DGGQRQTNAKCGRGAADDGARQTGVGPVGHALVAVLAIDLVAGEPVDGFHDDADGAIAVVVRCCQPAHVGQIRRGTIRILVIQAVVGGAVHQIGGAGGDFAVVAAFG